MSRSFRTQREDVVARRKQSEQRLRIVEKPPFPGDIHPLDKAKLERLLGLVPPEYLHGLRRIELRPRNHAVGAPFAKYRGGERVVFLYSLPMRWDFDGYSSSLAREVARAGAIVTRDGKRMRVAWPGKDGLRFWYFFDVFGHELGHHFDAQFEHKNGRRAGRRAEERFAEFSSAKLRAHVLRIFRQRRTRKQAENSSASPDPRSNAPS